MRVPVNPEISLFVKRMELQSRLRLALEKKGYGEVTTSTLMPSPGADTDIEVFKSFYRPMMERSVPPKDVFLHSSPEFAMKRLLCRGMRDIYQICQTFRQGELGPLHSPEFTMAEWYRTGYGWTELMAEVEEVVMEALEGRAFLNGQRLELITPFPRVSFFDLASELGLKADEWEGLSDLEYRQTFQRAVVDYIDPAMASYPAAFLTSFPARSALLAKVSRGPRPAAERFELYMGGIEIANGCSELTDPAEHRRRIEADLELRRTLEREVPPPPLEFLRDLTELGLPECAGVAVGLDRLAMLHAGAACVREVQALPFLE